MKLILQIALGIIAVPFVILGLIIVMAGIGAALPDGADASPTVESTPDVPASQLPEARNRGITRWAQKPANVRSGPGTSHEIVRRLARGEKVHTAPRKGAAGWYALIDTNSDTTGYVFPDLLGPPIPPPAPLEVESWNWVKDSDFGLDGAVIWTAVVRNNTSKYVRRVPVEITTYDAQDNVVDTDFSYATGLSPNGTASVKGYATYYGREKKASIRIIR